MAPASVPTNNCVAGIGSSNDTLTRILSAPMLYGGFGSGGEGSSCSQTVGTISDSVDVVIERIQQTISSKDLSIDVPDLPDLRVFGYSPLQSLALSGKYSVVMPDIRTLFGLSVGLGISICIGAVFAAILYRVVVRSNKEEERRSSNANSQSTAKVLTGLIIFLCSTLFPYLLIDILGARNTSEKFTISIAFVLYAFRSLEAIFNFVPPGATSSFGVYCAYYALPFNMAFDKQTSKPIMATKMDIWDSIIHVAKSLVSMCIMCSVLSPYGYIPFGASDAGEFHERIVFRDYLDARHLGNCFAIAVMFQQALALGMSALGLCVELTVGYKVQQSMRNPMLEATSPSDFWGRRWNVLVHALLKRSVYKPVRKFSSSVIASLAVFVASGLFHEWLVHAVFMHKQTQSNILLGSNTAFFVWNFVVIVLERVLAGTKGIKCIGKMIPSMLIPFTIIMASLPVAHWFGGPYLNGGFFDDYGKCMFLIRKS